MDPRTLLDRRRQSDRLEAAVVRHEVSHPGRIEQALHDRLRYVLSLARVGEVRNADGQDVDVSDALSRFRWRVAGRLGPPLEADRPDIGAALRELPTLLQAARAVRRRLLGHFPLDGESLDAEVTQRQLVVVCSGGGGSGYGFAGAYRLIHENGLQPALVAGTSMGSLISTFRARHAPFDAAKYMAAARSLSWQKVFRVLQMDSRYGIPATLRLYLRAALGSLFEMPDGRQATFRDMEIPLLVCVTGVPLDSLRHDLSYYENFLDDAVRPGVVFRTSGLRRLSRVLAMWAEFLSQPDSLQEIIFGADELTMDVDVLDAAGFSSAVTGFIHYDVIREDPHVRFLLDRIYGVHGVSRLTEGGLVNNLPARPAWAHAMAGKIAGGRRNPFVLGLDCFAPQKRAGIWYPVQQLVRPNVVANRPYCHHYFALERRLSPVDLVPTPERVNKAMTWTASELAPDMPYVKQMCRTLPTLPAEPRGRVGEFRL